MAFTPNEIQFAAGQIKPGKLSALATFCIEYLFNHKDGNLWHAVALLFNRCVVESYP